MAAGRFVSQVFNVGLQLHTRLSEAVWPHHPVLGPDKKVSIELGDELPGMNFERVVVRLNDEESAIDGYKRLSPPGSDETLIFLVDIESRVPGTKTSREVYARLGDLAAVAQGVLFDTTSESVRLLSFDGEIDVAHTDAVNPQVWQEQDGWIGSCTVTMRFQAAI